MGTEGRLRDLSGLLSDIDASALLNGTGLNLDGMDLEALPIIAADTRLGPCVGGVGKFVCIGLNYSDHAAETGATVPPEPIIFLKANTAICGPNDNIEQPRGSTKLDWEVELGLVIGKKSKYVAEAAAMDHIFGYCVINDVSERAFQMGTAFRIWMSCGRPPRAFMRWTPNVGQVCGKVKRVSVVGFTPQV